MKCIEQSKVYLAGKLKSLLIVHCSSYTCKGIAASCQGSWNLTTLQFLWKVWLLNFQLPFLNFLNKPFFHSLPLKNTINCEKKVFSQIVLLNNFGYHWYSSSILIQLTAANKVRCKQSIYGLRIPFTKDLQALPLPWQVGNTNHNYFYWRPLLTEKIAFLDMSHIAML